MEHEAAITSLAFRPGSGRTLAAGDAAGTVQFWNSRDWSSTQNPLRHDRAIAQLTWMTNNSNHLVTVCRDDHDVRVWNYRTGERLASLILSRAVESAAVFPGLGAVTAVQSTAYFWPVNSQMSGQPNPQRSYDHPPLVRATAIGPAGWIVTGGSDWRARVWHRSHESMVGAPMEHSATVGHLALDPDGRRLITSGGGLRIWELNRQPDRIEITSLRVGALRPDGRQIVQGNRELFLQDLPVGEAQALADSTASGSGWNDAAFSPDGTLLAAVAVDGSVGLWDVASRQLLNRQSLGRDIRRVAFDAAGQSIAVAAEGLLEVRAVPSLERREIAFKDIDRELLRSVCFHPTRPVLVTSGIRSGRYNDGEVVFWDLESGKVLSRVCQQNGRILDVAINADGSQLLTAGQDRIARLWDGGGETLLAALRHPAAVNRVAFSPAGRLAATLCNDDSARLWDLRTGRQFDVDQCRVVTIATSNGKVQFSGDGRTVMAMRAGSMVLWPVVEPLAGDAESLRVWSQLVTGLEQSDDGGIYPLTPGRWQRLSQQLGNFTPPGLED